MKLSLPTPYFYLFLIAIFVVYLIGMQLDLMDVDAAQYASISLEMNHRGEYLQITNRMVDYLDKPPLLFWTSALSFKLFGVSNFAYKLPSLMFVILAIVSIYHFCKNYYNENIAKISVIIFASSQALFLTTNDVRTDTILCSSIIFAVWQLCLYIDQKKISGLIWGSIGLGLAMLSKGPVGLFIPVFGLGFHLIILKKWKVIFNPIWILSLIIICIVLLPMCIGLYQQYGSEGLRFYFWVQSFGRITGENSWNNNPDPFFLVHSFAWSFIPWTLFFFVAFYDQLKDLIFKKYDQNKEYISVGLILFAFLTLSRSHYQLPHYIYVILPFAAIISAKKITQLLELPKTPLFYSYFQLFLVVVLFILLIILSLYCFEINITSISILILYTILLIYVFIKSKGLIKYLLLSFVSIIFVNLMINSHLYPSLHEYQSHSLVGKYIFENKIPQDKMYFYGEQNHSMDFYAQYLVKEINTPIDILNKNLKGDIYLFGNQQGIDSLLSHNIQPQMIKKYDHYHITTLKLPFLNPKTRTSNTEKLFLYKIKL